MLIAAADTFRAAAVEQLSIWADRAGVEIVKHKVREAQASLAQGRDLPPHLLEDLRQELKAVLP